MRCLRATVLLSCLVTTACQAAPRPSGAGLPSAPKHELLAVRDLSRDEEAGGHTLRKHVARTDDDLRERLRHERRISAASTYSDRATAERAVGAAIEEQAARIDRWLALPGGHPNFVLDYDGVQPIGRTLRRGAETAEPCAHAVVVLKWAGPADYFVLTSYPECR